jgi:hypothetical protein
MNLSDYAQCAKIALSMPIEFGRLLAAGYVDRETAWYMAKGAERFIESVARGDIATEAERTARRDVCRGCSSRVRLTIGGAESESDWCGDPGPNRLHLADKPTCGCLLAGKTFVGSEHCPQGKW